jgi:hypothetical protein
MTDLRAVTRSWTATIGGVCFFVSLCWLAPHTDAAVRTCHAPVMGLGSDLNSEQNARAAAIAAWTVEASRLGPTFGSFRASLRRTVICKREPSGTHVCAATAQPCRIDQVPGQTSPAPSPALKATPRPEQRA